MGWLASTAVIAWACTIGCAVSVLWVRGWIRRLRRLALVAVGVSFSVLLTALLILARAWEAFSGETLVATVTTQPVSQDAFILSYVPAGRTTSLVRAPFAADQWSISGGVIKWHPWLTALGLPSYHHPMRLEGRCSSPERQRIHPPTVVSLSASSTDRWWEWCYRWARWLPVIEAVYGSSAYVYAEPGVTHEIYVTPSGYLIKKRRMQPRE